MLTFGDSRPSRFLTQLPKKLYCCPSYVNPQHPMQDCDIFTNLLATSRSNYPEMLLVKGVLKICSKFIREHPCWSVVSITMISISVIWRFSMGVLLYICGIFSEYLLLRTPLDDCFWKSLITKAQKIVLLAYPITQNQNLKKSYFCPFQHIIQ